MAQKSQMTDNGIFEKFSAEMKSKLIVRGLLSLATTAYALSFLWAYFYMTPFQSTSIEISSSIFGWFLSVFLVVLASLIGMAVSFVKRSEAKGIHCRGCPILLIHFLGLETKTFWPME